MDEGLDLLQERVGYRFSSLALLKQALTHASLCADPLHSNERLEFLGDAVAALAVAEELFRARPDMSEGQMTATKAVVASRRTMARVGKALGLADFLRVGKDVAQQGKCPDSLIGNVYEAIAAAIYLDGGYEEAKRFVLETLGPEIQRVRRKEHVPDFKSVLQEIVQADGKPPPDYRTVARRGPDHNARFLCAVRVDGQVAGQGWGSNKKTAEQNAAQEALNCKYPQWRAQAAGA